MTVKTERLGQGHARDLIVTCDSGGSAPCRRTYGTRLRLRATGGDALYAVSQAVANGWWHVRRGGTMVDICPACATRKGAGDTVPPPPTAR